MLPSFQLAIQALSNRLYHWRPVCPVRLTLKLEGRVLQSATVVQGITGTQTSLRICPADQLRPCQGELVFLTWIKS